MKKPLIMILLMLLFPLLVSAQADEINGTIGFNVTTCITGASLSNNSHSMGMDPGDDSEGCITNATFSAVGGSKVYWENHINVRGRRHYTGVIGLGALTSAPGAFSTQTESYVVQATDLGDTPGYKFNNDGGVACLGVIVAGDVVSVAVDNSTGGGNKIWFGLNGVWCNSGNPGAGTNEAYSMAAGQTYFPVMGTESGLSPNSTFNFGASEFAYAVPTGFQGLDTVIGAGPTDSCTAPGSGDWAIDASDNCVLDTDQDVPGNIHISGTGAVMLSAKLTFTSANSIIAIDQGITFDIRSGGELGGT